MKSSTWDCKWNATWDYLEWKEVNLIANAYTQEDWTRTLITKVNQVSAQINMATMRGGADTIFVHPAISKLITNDEYYQPESKSLGGRYRVVITSKIPIYEIFICREEYFDLHYVSERIHNTSEYESVPLRDKHKTDREVESYRARLMGCIKISNYEQDDYEEKTIDMDKKKILLCDIDGTICEDIPNEEVKRMPNARVFPDARERLNQWFHEGDEIHFFTSRTEDMREVTVKWLADNGFNYHTLIMDKPRIKDDEVYMWIDNKPVKGVTHKGRWTALVDRIVTVTDFANEGDFKRYENIGGTD